MVELPDHKLAIIDKCGYVNVFEINYSITQQKLERLQKLVSNEASPSNDIDYQSKGGKADGSFHGARSDADKLSSLYFQTV